MWLFKLSEGWRRLCYSLTFSVRQLLSAATFPSRACCSRLSCSFICRASWMALVTASWSFKYPVDVIEDKISDGERKGLERIFSPPHKWHHFSSARTYIIQEWQHPSPDMLFYLGVTIYIWKVAISLQYNITGIWSLVMSILHNISREVWSYKPQELHHRSPDMLYVSDIIALQIYTFYSI